MNPKKREQTLALVAIAVVALMVGDKFVVNPLIKSWQTRSARIVALKKSVADGGKLLERDRTIRDRWQGMRTNTLDTEVSVAESQVLNAFERWSRASSVSISAFKPQWKRAADDHVRIECRADASGSLATLARFLYEIERDPMAMKVDNLDLTARDPAGKQLTLNLQVNGLIFTSRADEKPSK